MHKLPVVMALTAAALSVPVPASAQSPTPLCVAVPVDTIGAHVEVGDDEVHVPAVSNAKLCTVVWPPVGQSSWIDINVHVGCGFPCFTVVVERGSWTVVGTRVQAYLTYDVDGVPIHTPVADVPVLVRVDNPNPICVAVGNPIPECPSGSIAVPVPMP